MLCCLIGLLAAANIALARRWAAAGIAAALLVGGWLLWQEASAGDLDDPPICHGLPGAYSGGGAAAPREAA